jgi:2-polyprenyl-3-methyl-5-hydroxy-6-metoxy-1,4-benzoquinol methylase
MEEAVDSEKAGEYWGEFHNKVRPALSWLESPHIVERVNLRLTGDKDENIYQKFHRTSSRKFTRALMIGCGAGELERDLLKMGLFESCLGIDISKLSIEKAKSDATEMGIENIQYRVFDLDHDNYAELGQFDLIIIQMVAHHVSDLGYFFKNVNAMLRDNKSKVLMNEYIGPNRFQHDKKTRAIINFLLRSIPEKYKPNHLTDGISLREEYLLTPVSHFLANDPSEAIRSEEITKFAKKYLRIKNTLPYGGAINHMLLTGIISNFDLHNPDGELLSLLSSFEELLESLNVITSDFAVILADKK